MEALVFEYYFLVVIGFQQSVPEFYFIQYAWV